MSVYFQGAKKRYNTGARTLLWVVLAQNIVMTLMNLGFYASEFLDKLNNYQICSMELNALCKYDHAGDS
jgi:hypothetical protein